MKKQKNIDSYFKEQLGAFQENPHPEVWNAIEAQLKKEKEDRKVIPIWWKLAGVAAIIALLFTLGSPYIFNTTSQDTKIVSNPEPETIKEDSLTTPLNNNTLLKEAISNQNSPKEKSSITPQNTIKNSNKDVANSPEDATDKTIGAENNNNITPTNNKKEGRYKYLVNGTVAKSKTAVAENKNKEPLKNNKVVKSDEISQNSSIANTKPSTVNTTQNKNLNEIINNPIENPSVTINTEIIAKVESKEKPNSLENKLETTTNKPSIFDAIDEEKTKVAQQENTKNKNWEISPNIGPVYYNSLNQGSSIDAQFADNSKSGDFNVSYGVQVSYDVGKKWSVRTGINNVNLGYSTGGVEIATGPEAFGLENVNYKSTGRTVVTVLDRGAIMQSEGTNSDPFGQLNLKSSSPDAQLRQNISYFEVPLELKYSLLNKKIGINMIGGFSTLFLGTNEIVALDGVSRNLLGEANNLNNVSFTTNVGLGLDYKLTKSFKFNLEPIFKYQLNPYSDPSVNFRPYYFGVFTGFSFKF